MNNKALVEAALFVSEKPLSIAKISQITGIPESEVDDIVFEIQSVLTRSDRGIDLVETPEGYEFRIKPEYRDRVVNLAPFSDISEGMLRTLSIVAAKQPVKQSVIVRYQGNKSYGYISSLEEKGLVKTEKSGRTKLVMTTPDFEKYFGKSSDDIKKLLKSGEPKEKSS